MFKHCLNFPESNTVCGPPPFLCDKLANFLQILEVEPKIFQIMNHFVIFGHQTWGLEEGGEQVDPPPGVSWFSSTPPRIGLNKWSKNKWLE